jgi:hypothetical protein
MEKLRNKPDSPANETEPEQVMFGFGAQGSQLLARIDFKGPCLALGIQKLTTSK